MPRSLLPNLAFVFSSSSSCSPCHRRVFHIVVVLVTTYRAIGRRRVALHFIVVVVGLAVPLSCGSPLCFAVVALVVVWLSFSLLLWW